MERIGNMKVQIRKGVFETNSSSTHAINIYKGSDYVIPEHITVRTGDFGWENDYYDDPESKLAYLYTWCLSRCTSWVKNEITGQYESHYDHKLRKDYQYRIKSNLESLGIKDINFIDDEDDDGYIDHSGNLKEEDLEDILNYYFEDFIFNQKSCIITGNDNDEEDMVSEDYRADLAIYKGN